MLGDILLAFGTLFPIVNPFSTILVFNKLTRGWAIEKRRKTAHAAAMAAFFTLITFMFIGGWLLDFFSVTIYSFRIAGGLYLTWIGFQMLAPRPRRNPENYHKEGENIAIIPLAIPLLSGPGALTSVLVLSSEFNIFAVAIAIFLVCLVGWLVLHYAHVLERVLGHTGAAVVERILGIIVLTVAMQFVLNGVAGFIAAL